MLELALLEAVDLECQIKLADGASEMITETDSDNHNHVGISEDSSPPSLPNVAKQRKRNRYALGEDFTLPENKISNLVNVNSIQ